MNADVALGDQAFLALVDELDRIFDGDDVIRAGAVDQIDQRAQRRRFSRSRGAGDEDQSLGQVAKALHFGRDAHLLDGDDGRRNGAEYRAGSFAIAQGISAEAGDARDLVREVGVVYLLELGAVVI